MKRVLVLGSGGREHALAWRLSREAEVHVAPGNPGMAACVQLHSCQLADQDAVSTLARILAPHLVVIGPEDPLVAGLADRLRGEGFSVLGPGAAGARHEESKAWSKRMMAEAGVPTSPFEVFTEFEPAVRFAMQRFDAGAGVAVKASGPALGKGAVICTSREEARDALELMLVFRELGEAGSTVVVEDLAPGREFSLLTLVNESGISSFPVAQDYKRIGTGGVGPNTGGMGSASPVSWVGPDLVAETEERVVRPILREMLGQGIAYRGVLFSGLMHGEQGLSCLEYNVRFGDPETQTVMRRVGGSLLDALTACAEGRELPAIEALPEAALTVVLAAAGYPGPVRKGDPITIPAELPAEVQIFLAGVSKQDGELVTSGGRVLGVSATGGSLSEAKQAAYSAADQIQFDGKQMREDIGDLA